MTPRTRKLGYVVLALIVAGGALAFVTLDRGGSPGEAARVSLETDPGTMVVYKSQFCGCCEKWVDHMRDAGFTVRSVDREDMGAVKQELGVPRELSSCHTAVIDGKVVEGHVPAEEVRRWLDAGAPGAGLAVPGMPAGSPGMPSPTPEPYDVLTFDRDGSTQVFSSR